MFLLVPAHPGFPGQIPQSRKTVVCCVCIICSQCTDVDCCYMSIYSALCLCVSVLLVTMSPAKTSEPIVVTFGRTFAWAQGTMRYTAVDMGVNWVNIIE